MSSRIGILAALFVLTAVVSLNFTPAKPVVADDYGKELFTRHCGVCHMLPDVKSLTKDIWQYHVLPVMAARMGIIYPNYDPLRGLSPEEKAIVNRHHIIPEEPELNNEDWAKLVAYVAKNAPDSIILDKSRLTRDAKLKQFIRNDIELPSPGPSLITGLKYNAATQTLLIGNYFNQVFNWKYDKGVVKTMKTQSPVVDFNFYKDHTYLTEIGKLYPTELSLGAYVQLNDTVGEPLTAPLHRPVHSEIEDLNNDGIPEIVVCNFGNKIGSLSLFKQDKHAKYKEEVLLPLPGAIKCYIKDMDGDGKKDIVAMFAQGDESVFIFYQKENMKFRAKRVLRFPPDYGTTDMILVDYNHDGKTDIITVHGDNADYSDILKPYHGIRINIADTGNKYEEKFFYPIYGVTRLLADDFDKDGDIDLVATSFFPDFGKLIDESFIYLENTSTAKFTFKPYIQKSTVPIKTLTLEEADIDGDGDMDIITGLFAQNPGPVPQSLDDKWKSVKYGINIFINQLY